jgi:hypothetical protein
VAWLGTSAAKPTLDHSGAPDLLNLPQPDALLVAMLQFLPDGLHDLATLVA